MGGWQAGRDVREQFGPIVSFFLSLFDVFDEKLQCTELDRELSKQKSVSVSAAKNGRRVEHDTCAELLMGVVEVGVASRDTREYFIAP